MQQVKLYDPLVTHGPCLSALDINSLYIKRYKFICFLYFTPVQCDLLPYWPNGWDALRPRRQLQPAACSLQVATQPTAKSPASQLRKDRKGATYLPNFSSKKKLKMVPFSHTHEQPTQKLRRHTCACRMLVAASSGSR